MLAADGCASSSSDPACCFCAVWAPAGRGSGGRHVRAHWFGHAHLPKRGRCLSTRLCTGVHNLPCLVGALTSQQQLLRNLFV